MQIDKLDLINILKNRFGFDKFREGQLEAICTLMQKDRLLCIQPTGHGKSLLYQLPTVLLDGLTLVISPLLALMRDQMSHLTTRFNIPAASINTDQSEAENNNARKLAHTGKIRILFVAPEQLDDIERFEFLLSLPISLIVIDEAHCISTWGHDFRPSYRQIIHLVQNLEKSNALIKVLGLTATANHKTEIDITQQLATDKPILVHRANMDRPNIQLSVIQSKGLASKLFILRQLIAKLEGDGLIYCATRENSELVAEFCQKCNINAVAYHAGMEADVKRKLQHNFIDGKYKVIAATNALGMGIDKSDLRFIIHFDVPGSITAYYQEIGRCGRDGLPAYAILLFDPQDKKIQQHFINSAQPSEPDFHHVLNVVADSKKAPNLMTIKCLTGLHPTRVSVIIAELIEQNLLRKAKRDRLQIYLRTQNTSQPDLTRYKNQYQVKTQELQAMLHYGEQNDVCRMLMLRKALGDQEAKPCDHCDVCINQSFPSDMDTNRITNITNWLTGRTVNIKAIRTNNIAAGVAVLDGKLRSPLFIQFMKQRAHSNDKNLGLSEALLSLIKQRLATLAQKYNIGSVISIPSRTWSARNQIVAIVAKELNVPTLPDILTWRELPLKRQGELLNNDQRRYNVDKKVTVNKKNFIPKGAILLLDDYIGSGATIKEAVRALRKEAYLTQEIIPFAIALIKWRLGQPGMI